MTDAPFDREALEMISVIKTASQHKKLLARISALIDLDPIADSMEGKELEVLAVLVKDFESTAYPLAPPSPLAAIRLRMEQMELAPKDLVPFLGSRSRVSEVFAGRRPLSLAMIRSLHSGLLIPLESLVAEEEENDPIGGVQTSFGVLLKTDRVRTAASSDRYALAAWASHARQEADGFVIKTSFDKSSWGPARFRELRNLSQYDVGPRLAVQFLSDRGIALVIAPHLKRTRLDGAAMLRTDGTPVIALTLRHDRIDRFWFTLFHELMHVILHFDGAHAGTQDQWVFLDDLDITAETSQSEKEADEAAREALVPTAAWNQSAVRHVIAPATVTQLANELGVSKAIVAGRVRFERRNYRLLSSMVGAGQVRVNFPDVKWSADD